MAMPRLVAQDPLSGPAALAARPKNKSKRKSQKAKVKGQRF
jgi:hypothetical protein